jgi:hypothetical protein
MRTPVWSDKEEEDKGEDYEKEDNDDQINDDDNKDTNSQADEQDDATLVQAQITSEASKSSQ